MNLEQFHQMREARAQSEPRFRTLCRTCRRPTRTCYCEHVRPFDSNPQFVILIHPSEAKRSPATGRMTHLCLSNSRLIEGSNFTENQAVNDILDNPENYCVLLYLHRTALNISQTAEPAALFPKGKRYVVFIIDATWHEAKRMRRLSTNLHLLPMICFNAPKPSAYKVRKQPKPDCLSTIEAAHHLIEVFSPEETQHENMLEVFDFMVNLQLTFDVGRVRGKRRSHSQ